MLGRWSYLGQDKRFVLLESQLPTNGRGQGQLRIDAKSPQFLFSKIAKDRNTGQHSVKTGLDLITCSCISMYGVSILTIYPNSGTSIDLPHRLKAL